ncbi:MAG: hypothetical protein KZQ86_18560, partial [Candidatus Thiodiazotropha sp. (ex Lucinoma kastoroae)]|nr:hypothetical protein [Candidatus Thiodiazotropha sp. (ex Lucinoma kastoroae)]
MSNTGSLKWRAWLISIPLPALSLLVGILCGLVTWLLLDPVQDKRLEQVFHSELVRRLDIRAVETRHRFEQFLREWQLAGHGLSNHWQIITYLNTYQWLESELDPKHYRDQIPSWLEPGHPNLSSIEPSHVVLFDSHGDAREIYQKKPLSFSLEHITELYTGHDEALITLIDQLPYLLVWSNITYQRKSDPAVLLLIVAVDEQFLAESQKMAQGTDTLIALIDAENQKLLVSSNSQQIPQDSYLWDWQDSYLLTSQALTRYQFMEQSLLFSTLVSRDVVQKTIRNITKLAQLDRLLAALVYVVAFSIIFYLISTKISHVLKRISRYGQQALGVEQPV